MAFRLEHANLLVRDIDATLRFLTTALPDLEVRGSGTNPQGMRWIHVGDAETYIALNQASRPAPADWVPYRGEPGTNHLAFEVDDAEAVHQRLRDAGYRDSTVPNAHPHRRRIYFYDDDGNDWEFVEYLSEDRSLRNDYELPD
jgi:catechol 2,3-dioxygenase-like lactoylglutathione lyase family enzyme